MRNGLIVCQYYLTDANPGDGGLCVIPGSHKSNYECPEQILTWEADREVVYEVPMKAGDLLIADARLMHAAWPNQTSQRRT